MTGDFLFFNNKKGNQCPLTVSVDNNDFASFANDVCGLAYVHLQPIDQQFQNKRKII